MASKKDVESSVLQEPCKMKYFKYSSESLERFIDYWIRMKEMCSLLLSKQPTFVVNNLNDIRQERDNANKIIYLSAFIYYKNIVHVY